MRDRLSPHFLIALLAILLSLVTFGRSSIAVLGQGTPAATPVPACVQTVSPVRTPSPTLSELSSRRLALVQTTEALISCRAAADWNSVVARMLPSLLQSQVGTAEPVAAAEAMARLSDAGFLVPFEVQTIGEPTVTGTFGSIDLTTREGHVLRRQEWTFALENGEWMLSTMAELPPLLDIIAVGTPIKLDSAGLHALRTELVNPGAIVFDLVNELDRVASFTIFQVDGTGATDVRSDLLQGAPPHPSTVIGWTECAAGEACGLALVDLPEGTYLVVGGYDPRVPVEPVEESAIVQISIED